jgi:pSer/pThr/pTyr-binding forkhead associated (FHA) protein
MPWKVTISVTGGSQRGEQFEFFKDSVLIGRSKRADLALNDTAISAEHCRILIKEDSVEVEDLGSKNGSFLNQLPVDRSEIKTGDRIQLGKTELEVHLELITEKNRLSSALYPAVMIAGFNEQQRDYFSETLVSNLVTSRVFGFANGEDLLVESVKWFEEMRGPDLVILDFKMTVINGINTAISLRAYERAYKRGSLVPLLFFCDPPDSDSFRKVLNFCSPAMLFPRQLESSDFESQVQSLIKNLRRAPVG